MCVCVCVCVCVCARAHACARMLSCVQLFLTLWGCSPFGSSVHGILQARILEWVAMPSSSRGFPRPWDRTHISCIAGRFFTPEPPGKPLLEALFGPFMLFLLFAQQLLLPPRTPPPSFLATPADVTHRLDLS